MRALDSVCINLHIAETCGFPAALIWQYIVTFTIDPNGGRRLMKGEPFQLKTEKIKKMFKFLTDKQINEGIAQLEKVGLIQSGEFYINQDLTIQGYIMPS